VAEDTDVYRRLQQHLDAMPVGFPATASGIELRILRRLFTPEEAEVALCLSAVPERPARIAGRARGRSKDEVQAALEAMADNCVCRQGKDLLGQPCGRGSGRRVCLMLGAVARKSIALGSAEAVSPEEALELLARAERDGLVVQPSNTRDPAFVCFCCPCCCGV